MYTYPTMHLAKLHVHSSVQIKIISIGNQFADVKLSMEKRLRFMHRDNLIYDLSFFSEYIFFVSSSIIFTTYLSRFHLKRFSILKLTKKLLFYKIVHTYNTVFLTILQFYNINVEIEKTFFVQRLNDLNE